MSEQPDAGVTEGYLVLWSGEAGPAQIAKAARLVDDAGESVFVLNGAFESCTVSDDTPPRVAGA